MAPVIPDSAVPIGEMVSTKTACSAAIVSPTPYSKKEASGEFGLLCGSARARANDAQTP